MDRPARLERLARWYAEAFQTLDVVERQIQEVLVSLGLETHEDAHGATAPTNR